MAWVGTIDDLLLRAAADDGVRRGLLWLRDAAGLFPPGAEPGFSSRVEIAGDDLFALPQIHRTKSPAEGRFEAHRRHIDIQCVVAGAERIDWAPLNAGRAVEAYDEPRDIAFYEVRDSSSLHLGPAMAAVFFPGDLHAPCLAAPGAEIVRKVVVKVRLP